MDELIPIPLDGQTPSEKTGENKPVPVVEENKPLTLAALLGKEPQTFASLNKKYPNLKPWQKGGPSPNPGGRPKKLPFTERIGELADAPLPKDIAKKLGLKKGATWADGLVLKQFREALTKGSTAAFRELREAVEGTTPRRPDLLPEIREVIVKVVYDNGEGVKASVELTDLNPPHD